MANTVEIIVKAKDQASKVLSGVGSTLANLGDIGTRVAGGVAVASAAIAAGAVLTGKSMMQMAVDALPMQGVEAAYRSIADAADEMLESMRFASAGMATDLDLMKSYNLAAQLVSETFAEQLPEALQYLTKVSAATGTDMGYLMDSLVTGVGRLSPKIIDNLGVQLNLNDAYESYAKSIGKVTGELTQEEKQAAVMAVIMRKLAENTADMPDIVGTAQAEWNAFNTSIKNAKLEIGTALIPALQMLMPHIQRLVDQLLPVLVRLAERIPGLVEQLTPVLISVVEWIIQFADGNTRLNGTLAAFMEHADLFLGALAAIGAVLGAGMIYNAIVAIGAVIGALSWPILAVIAAAALLGVAWASNWGGIQEKTAAVVEWLRGAIGDVTEWLRGIWAKHGEEVSAHWTAMWAKISETASAVAAAVGAIVGVALETIRAWWAQHGEQVMVIVRLLWDTIKAVFETAFNAIREFCLMVMDAIAGDWTSAGEHWMNIVTTLWEGIKRIFTNQITALWELIKLLVKTIQDIVKDIDWKGLGKSIIEGIKTGVMNAAKALANAVANAARAALDAAKRALGISSPSKVAAEQIGRPFVEGIGRGIDQAMKGMARMQMPQMATQMVNASQRGMATAQGNRTTNQTYNLNVYTNAATEPIVADFNMMRAFAG